MKKTYYKYLFIAATIISVLYGTSYQQFKYFNPDNPRGLTDAISYIKMAQGNYDVTQVRKYRTVIPEVSRIIYKILNHTKEQSIPLLLISFYFVNFLFIFLAAFFLFFILETLGFKFILSLLGTVLFLSSRDVVISTGIPLTDSGFLFSISFIIYCCLKKKVNILTFCMPILLILKETSLPFLLLPLRYKEFRKFRYVFSILLSSIIFLLFRKYIDYLHPSIANQTNFFGIVDSHIHLLKKHIIYMFTLRGIHDLFHGFLLLYPIAGIGFYLNFKQKLYDIPKWLYLCIPIAFGFSLLSGNLGRMFFCSYPIIIPGILIVISRISLFDKTSET